jgi:hypothetical protein
MQSARSSRLASASKAAYDLAGGVNPPRSMIRLHQQHHCFKFDVLGFEMGICTIGWSTLGSLCIRMKALCQRITLDQESE